MEIRDAVPSDARAACEVLRRSITELCVADHRNEPAILERWLANKTPEIVASWIAQAGSSVLVAVEAGAILAVGSVTDTGEVMLNYVSPDARFRGLSRAMLRALENRAVERGNARCTLLSTETARRFYHDAGYAEEGPPQGKFGTSSSYPMSKRLPLLTEFRCGSTESWKNCPPGSRPCGRRREPRVIGISNGSPPIGCLARSGSTEMMKRCSSRMLAAKSPRLAASPSTPPGPRLFGCGGSMSESGFADAASAAGLGRRYSNGRFRPAVRSPSMPRPGARASGNLSVSSRTSATAIRIC
jgi:GNAT superfamily N-acetyltransferase